MTELIKARLMLMVSVVSIFIVLLMTCNPHKNMYKSDIALSS